MFLTQPNDGNNSGDVAQKPYAQIQLRISEKRDLDAMHALDVACFEKSFRFTRSAMRRFVEAENANAVIAEQNDVLVGFVILHLEEADRGLVGYVVTLDVAEDHRRKGIAEALMHRAEEVAVQEGCIGMALHVFMKNESAILFYAHTGFVRLHCERNFYGHGLDAWLYYKVLNGAR